MCDLSCLLAQFGYCDGFESFTKQQSSKNIDGSFCRPAQSEFEIIERSETFFAELTEKVIVLDRGVVKPRAIQDIIGLKGVILPFGFVGDAKAILFFMKGSKLPLQQAELSIVMNSLDHLSGRRRDAMAVVIPEAVKMAQESCFLNAGELCP